MIYDAFTAQANAIPYPERSDFADKGEYVEARRQYSLAHGEVNKAFGVALAEEYLGDIAESRRQSVGELTFALAWEHGHSSGYSEVENYYLDFSEFALKVYAAATN